ncbi:MAG: prepilin-type N-terminal cleavage/methylation domain-containing protein, partial [Finegoldia magna]|nr:prepilin-type N-terminal cleavage/methylation domain-containing protein [Finegoldia magna]
MRRKTKGFTLLEVLFALFLVSICVVVYYPQLENVIKMQDKSYTENVVLRDLDNSVEYLKAHDDVDSSIVDENSKVVVTKDDVGDLVKV